MHAPKRYRISTVSKYDRIKAAKKRRAVAASKAKKNGAAPVRSNTPKDATKSNGKAKDGPKSAKRPRKERR